MACAHRSGAPGSVSTTRSPNRSSRPSRKSSFIPGRGRPLTNSAPPCSNISSRTTTGVEGIRQSATTPRSNTRRSTHSHGYKPRNRVSTRSGTLQVDWCTADAVYGRDRGLRESCEQRGIGYSLGVPCSFRVKLPSGTTMRADATVKKILTPRSWQVASCGEGSKGDRRYTFAWLATASPRHFLLIRRSLTKPAELAYFYCYVPDGVPATLGVLFAVTAAEARTRSEPLPTPDTPTQPPPADLGLIPLTVVEIKRLFNLAAQATRSISHHLRWSWWRRRHQARARWYHHRARLA